MRQLAAILLLVPATAFGLCGSDHIGIFDHSAPGLCDVDIAPFVPQLLEIEAFLPHAEGGLRELEFRVEDWIGNPGYPLGLVTVSWEGSPTVTGDLASGVSLAWSEALEPCDGEDHYRIGSIEILSFSDDWPAEDEGVCIVDCSYLDQLVHPSNCWGGCFTFNCSDCYDSCYWPPFPDLYFDIHGFSPAPNSEVGESLLLSFSALAWNCWPNLPVDYDGHLMLAGEKVHSFYGSGEGDHEAVIDLSGFAAGEEVILDLFLITEFCSYSLAVAYIRSEDTAVPPGETTRTSFSAFRALY